MLEQELVHWYAWQIKFSKHASKTNDIICYSTFAIKQYALNKKQFANKAWLKLLNVFDHESHQMLSLPGQVLGRIVILLLLIHPFCSHGGLCTLGLCTVCYKTIEC